MQTEIAELCLGKLAHLLGNGIQLVSARQVDPRRMIMAPTWSVRRDTHDHQIIDVEELDLLCFGRSLSDEANAHPASQLSKPPRGMLSC